MGKSDFENLRVFQMAERLADEVWNAVKRWDGFSKRTVGQQIVRAGDSVGANIAEGAGRGSYADNQRFVRIARGSLYEVKFFLRRAHRRGLLTEAQTELLWPLIDELAPTLNAYLRSLNRRTTNN